MAEQFEVTLVFHFDRSTKPQSRYRVMALTNASLVRLAKSIGFAHFIDSSFKVVE